MAVVVTGMEGLLVSLNNIADRSSRGARSELQKGAIEIRNLARRMAPVDEGNLEESIKEGSFRGVDGRNVYTVEVDETVVSSTGGVVGDYAERMHEGDYHLGLKSEVKQAGNPDIYVGRKFLERAMEDLDDEIKRKVEAKVSQGIGH